MKEDDTINRFKGNFLAASVYTVLTLLLIIPALLLENIGTKLWVGILVSVLIYFMYPLLQLVKMKSFPVLVEVIICLQTMLSLTFANAFNMYSVISNWDLILHGLLGIELLAFGYFLLINNGGSSMTILGRFIFLFMFVIGVAGLWEILEYIAYNITGHDFQHITDFKRGDTPLDDTMTDMIISLVTSTITYLVIVIDYFLGGKLIKIVTKSLIIDKEKKDE